MEALNDYQKAGKIAAEAREYSKKLCTAGALYLEIAEKVEQKILALGGKPAFPVDISVNSMAAHYSPGKEDVSVLHEGDVVKVDLGVHINGRIADTAVTVEVGSTAYSKMIRAAEEALEKAAKIVKPGVPLCEIGAVIQETISSYGYSPVKNLSGHGLDDYEVHMSPTVPNYDNGDKHTLEEDMVIAIEPFATNGVGLVKDGKVSGIYQLISPKPVRLPNVRKVLDYIYEEFKTLPFCVRWLKDVPNIAFVLRLLEKDGVIKQYTQLPEKSGGIVSQAEHTVVVGKGIITKD